MLKKPGSSFSRAAYVPARHRREGWVDMSALRHTPSCVAARRQRAPPPSPGPRLCSHAPQSVLEEASSPRILANGKSDLKICVSVRGYEMMPLLYKSSAIFIVRSDPCAQQQ